MSLGERWSDVDRIFAGALERPLSERGAFLDAACHGDPELRREIEELLAADGDAEAFLERPAGELLGFERDESAEGTSLGPYRLLRRLGSGGTGTVYLARREDEHYEREVAVKVLRYGLESTEAHYRFLAERQILARLEHPDIARLYDGGSTPDGRPYLVMEWVDGIPVDQYCDRHRLTVEQRLDLFRRLCAAVQHAHQNLLVHRDLKPANILVTAAGDPKLLDFGIAKRLETAAVSRTRTGLRVMTPSYASPEQVRGGPITTASDVYSLGVLLYELLAGRGPFPLDDASAPWELERAICEDEPERPSAAVTRPGEALPPETVAHDRRTRVGALQRRLRGDLDNIVLRALRKEPGRRYGSAASLARDLERHRESLPVAARPDTLGYRTLKLLRRRRGAAAAGVAMLAVAAVFLASLVSQHRRLIHERDKARSAMSFLVDTFKQADPYQSGGERVSVRELLDQGAVRGSQDLARQPEVQSAVLDAIGEVDRGLGRFDAARPLLERALELRRRHAGPGSLEVAESLEHLGNLAADRSDYPTAERQLRQALAIRRRLNPRSLEEARLLLGLSDVLLAVRKPQAGDTVAEALAIAHRVEGPAGPTVAEALIYLGRQTQEDGQTAEGERLYREGLAMEERVLEPGTPRRFLHQATFAEMLINSGKPQEAEAVLRRILAEDGSALGPDHPHVVMALGNLAMAAYDQKRFAEAEALNRQVLAKIRARFGPDYWQLSPVLGNLATALKSQGRTAEAIPYLKEAMELRRRQLGPEHPMVAQAHLLLAGAYREQARYGDALDEARQGLAILEKTEGPDHPHLAYAAREIGRIFMAQGRYAAAEPYLRRSLDIRRKALEPDHPEIARAKATLADCLLHLGRRDEARSLVQGLTGADAAKVQARLGVSPRSGLPASPPPPPRSGAATPPPPPGPRPSPS